MNAKFRGYNNDYDKRKLDVLKILLEWLKTLAFEAKVLDLDKWIATSPIIDHLTSIHQPVILVLAIRGKAGGTQALCRGHSSCKATYTFTKGTSTTGAMKASLVPDKTGKLHRKWLAFSAILLDWPVEKSYHEYRCHFGSECSYRFLRRVRRHYYFS